MHNRLSQYYGQGWARKNHHLHFSFLLSQSSSVIQLSGLRYLFLYCLPYYFIIFTTMFLLFLSFYLLLLTNWVYHRILNLLLLSPTALPTPAEGSLASAQKISYRNCRKSHIYERCYAPILQSKRESSKGHNILASSFMISVMLERALSYHLQYFKRTML